MEEATWAGYVMVGSSVDSLVHLFEQADQQIMQAVSYV